MEKLDLTKMPGYYYKAKPHPEVVNLAAGQFLTITGKGAPESEAFSSSVEALYPVAYGIKKQCKDAGMDFGVPKLEGLWWVEGNQPPLETPREEWHWKLMIRMPDFATEAQHARAVNDVETKKKRPLAREVKFELFDEGTAVQMLHTGPYANEPESLALMEAFILAGGYTMVGQHHEIYLSDPFKTAPERLRTILRHPVVRKN
jgi:hypothetical protein